MKNLKEHLREKSDENTELKFDISILARSPNEEIFMKGWKLLKFKWNKNKPDFITYFENNYILKNNKCRVGCDPIGIETNNNFIESFNSLIKKSYTHKKILEVFKFLI